MLVIILSSWTSLMSLTAAQEAVAASQSNDTVDAYLSTFKSESKNHHTCAENDVELSKAIASFCKGTNGTGVTVPAPWSSTSTFSSQRAWHVYIQANACRSYHDYLQWVDNAMCKRRFENLCSNMISEGRNFGVYGVFGCEIWVLARANAQNTAATPISRYRPNSLISQRPPNASQIGSTSSNSNLPTSNASCLGGTLRSSTVPWPSVFRSSTTLTTSVTLARWSNAVSRPSRPNRSPANALPTMGSSS